MNNFGKKANFIWSVADSTGEIFKPSKYQIFIFTLTVLRRINCAFEPIKSGEVKGQDEEKFLKEYRL